MGKCEDCVHCIWDGEYFDTGHKAYDNWYCNQEDNLTDDVSEKLEQLSDNFPGVDFNCDKFLLDFWKSEFAKEVDGTDESLKVAMQKWEEKYCKVAS